MEKFVLVRTTTVRFPNKYDISRPCRGIPIGRSHSQTSVLGYKKCNTKDITCYWLGISRHCCSVQRKRYCEQSISRYSLCFDRSHIKIYIHIDCLCFAISSSGLSWAAFRYFQWCSRWRWPNSQHRAKKMPCIRWKVYSNTINAWRHHWASASTVGILDNFHFTCNMNAFFLLLKIVSQLALALEFVTNIAARGEPLPEETTTIQPRNIIVSADELPKLIQDLTQAMLLVDCAGLKVTFGMWMWSWSWSI